MLLPAGESPPCFPRYESEASVVSGSIPVDVPLQSEAAARQMTATRSAAAKKRATVKPDTRVFIGCPPEREVAKAGRFAKRTTFPANELYSLVRQMGITKGLENGSAQKERPRDRSD